ncbi:MAG: hypothetical protein AAEC03_10335, partial [Synechococcus sp.]
MPRRLRLWLLLVVLGLALSMSLGSSFSADSSAVEPPSGPTPQTIDWGSNDQGPSEQLLPALRVGAYITNLSDINLLDDEFSIELLLWTLWQGDSDTNP